MKLYAVELDSRKFHLYVLQDLPANLDEQELLSDVHHLTIGKLFRMIKTSLDMKSEVLVIDHFNYDKKYSLLHKHHHHFSSGSYLYLNISIRNKILSLFDENSPVNNFQSLEDNNKLINFFS